MRIDFVTLFPQMVIGALNHSVVARAQERGLAEFGAADPRDFAYDAHRTVDDSPYGGGAGMVLRPEPVARAIEWLITNEEPTDRRSGVGDQGREAIGDSRLANPDLRSPSGVRGLPTGRATLSTLHVSYPRARAVGAGASPVRSPSETTSRAIVLTDPTGEPFSQAAAWDLSSKEHVVFVCGRYEGIDDRIRTLYATHVCSVGDFIVTGGELPALLMADAVVRLIPGVLGSPDSLHQDSHAGGLLTAPQFTRPEAYAGIAVPDELRCGDHKQAARWKREQALQTTRRNRPDLFCKAPMAKSDLDLLSF